MISDAAKAVCVENHVLRYWEEELHLPIHRNESGHRIYSEEDVECFKQIKDMKEKGLQLKAIHTLLKSGNLGPKEAGREEGRESLPGHENKENEGVLQRIKEVAAAEENQSSERIIRVYKQQLQDGNGGSEDKIQRIQWLFNELIKKSLQETLPETMEQVMTETLEQHKKAMCTDIRESLVKELDYQFRMQTEREEEREKAFLERSEFYYEQIDELLRRKRDKKKKRFLFK